MKKKFNEWRSKLTCAQKEALITISGVVCILFAVWSFRYLAEIRSKTPMVIAVLAAIVVGVLLIIGVILTCCSISMLIVYKTLDFTERRLLKIYKEKLDKDELIEVFFLNVQERPKGTAGEFYWYMKNCTMPHWFAKWENKQIYVVLKDEDKFVKDWKISEIEFFDYWFKFTKN